MPNDDPVADRFFHLVTHLGDSALLIPLTLAVTFVLWRGAHRGAAWRFGGAVAASVLLTLVAKLLFYADGGSEELDILSPSGHASFGIAVYGGLALLLARRRPPGVQALIGLGALALVLAIAASRIVLETHTPAEVAFGTAVGTACLAVSALAGPEARPLTLRAPLWLLVLLALGSVSVWGVGHRFDTERRIEQLGTHLGSAFGPS